MNKIILSLICGIFFLSFISALQMEVGTCNYIDFPNQDDVNISFIGNSSSMEGFNWNKNGTLIEYCLSPAFIPDNFSIEWYNYEYVYVADNPSSGGSSGGSSAAITQPQMEEGATLNIMKGKYIPFTLKTKHKIFYHGEVDGKYKFTLQSELIDVYLSVGENKDVILDLDTLEAVNIKLISVQNNEVEILISEIKIEEIFSDAFMYNRTIDSEDPCLIEGTCEDPIEKEKENYIEIIVICFLIILLLFIILIGYRVAKEDKKQ